MEQLTQLNTSKIKINNWKEFEQYIQTLKDSKIQLQDKNGKINPLVFDFKFDFDFTQV